MIFKRKKKTPAQVSTQAPAQHVMRGRDTVPRENPLARRLRTEDEPATVDLDSGVSFPADAAPADQEPPTRDLGDEPLADPGHAPEPESPVRNSAGRLVITQGSAGGVVVDGVPAAGSTDVFDGSEIRVGDTVLRFESAD